MHAKGVNETQHTDQANQRVLGLSPVQPGPTLSPWLKLNSVVTLQGEPLPDVHEREMVAAPFDSDNLWYRAEVSAVEDDRVDLYYGDFGDSCWVDKNRIRRLRL